MRIPTHRGLTWLAAPGIVAAVAVAAVMWLNEAPAAGQAAGSKAVQRLDGKPNLNGIWQALGTAHWNLEDQSARQGPVISLGAIGAIPGGRGVVEGGSIPYQPKALERKKQNAAKWLELDPEVKCYLPGVPRAMYLPFPFQIVQTSTTILMAFEFASAVRTVHLRDVGPSPVDTWMGHSQGKWDGDTLVIESNAFNGQAWLDRSGNFASETLKVTERITPRTPDALDYEATLEDPAVFTRPWKIRMPLYRRLEEHAQLLEFKCVEFVEELMYGHLKKPGSK